MQDSLIQKIGGMRIALLTLAVVCYPLAWLADMEPQGVGILTAYVVPALVVILFFVLLLDSLMNRVFMIDKEGEELALYRLRMRLCLLAVLGLLVFWVPYFRSLGEL